jgi:hypothetical protein
MSHVSNQSKDSKQPLTIALVSRARSLKGLKVIALPQNPRGGANQQVKEFMASFSGKNSIAFTP